jgi:hypothetical protein
MKINLLNAGSIQCRLKGLTLFLDRAGPIQRNKLQTQRSRVLSFLVTRDTSLIYFALKILISDVW